MRIRKIKHQELVSFMLEVPEVKIPQFIGDGKDEIIPVIDNPVNAVQNRTKLCVPER